MRLGRETFEQIEIRPVWTWRTAIPSTANKLRPKVGAQPEVALAMEVKPRLPCRPTL
jgi:hypothetical protein